MYQLPLHTCHPAFAITPPGVNNGESQGLSKFAECSGCLPKAEPDLYSRQMTFKRVEDGLEPARGVPTGNGSQPRTGMLAYGAFQTPVTHARRPRDLLTRPLYLHPSMHYPLQRCCSTSRSPVRAQSERCQVATSSTNVGLLFGRSFEQDSSIAHLPSPICLCPAIDPVTQFYANGNITSGIHAWPLGNHQFEFAAVSSFCATAGHSPYYKSMQCPLGAGPQAPLSGGYLPYGPPDCRASPPHQSELKAQPSGRPKREPCPGGRLQLASPNWPPRSPPPLPPRSVPSAPRNRPPAHHPHSVTLTASTGHARDENAPATKCRLSLETTRTFDLPVCTAKPNASHLKTTKPNLIGWPAGVKDTSSRLTQCHEVAVCSRLETNLDDFAIPSSIACTCLDKVQQEHRSSRGDTSAPCIRKKIGMPGKRDAGQTESEASGCSTSSSSSEDETPSAEDELETACRDSDGDWPLSEQEKRSETSIMRRRTNVVAVKPVNPAVYRRFMEQKMANLGRTHREREERQARLEAEMSKIGLDESSRAQMRRLLRKKESNHMRMQRAKMDQTMFVRIKRLGVGAFGRVWLVRKKDNGQLYAMKLLKKRDVVQRRQLAHVQAERDILAEADNDWVVKLFFSFQDAHVLYLVMEYIPGGDMMSLLIKKEIFVEELARFYAAELTLALESVHALGFVHRDIKPDNVLITREGHIKLTDFGLCTGFRWTHSSKYWDLDLSISETSKDGLNGSPSRDDAKEPRPSLRLEEEETCIVAHDNTLERRVRSFANRKSANSLVGTPNYIAPEILRRQEYNQACDWWSVGVILYEMLVGRPPFVSQTAMDTQIRVVQWQKYLHIPAEPRLSSSAGDLIRRFLCDPKDRLANPVLIKAHRFFDNLQWDALPTQKAPYIPVILDELDTSNFDAVEDNRSILSGEEHGSSLTSTGTGLFGAPHPFPNFTFKRFFDWEPTVHIPT